MITIDKRIKFHSHNYSIYIVTMTLLKTTQYKYILIYLCLGRTSLMWAAYEGHADVAKILLEKGANVNLKDKEG